MMDPNNSVPGIESHPDLQEETFVMGAHFYFYDEEAGPPQVIAPGVGEFIHISGCPGSDGEDSAADIQISGTSLEMAYMVLQSVTKALKDSILRDNPDAAIFDLDNEDTKVQVVHLEPAAEEGR